MKHTKNKTLSKPHLGLILIEAAMKDLFAIREWKIAAMVEYWTPELEIPILALSPTWIPLLY